MRQSRTRYRGFTIMELMVVVAIIVALLAILIPAMGHIRKQAARTGVNQQMIALKMGLTQYYTDCSSYYPPSTPGNGLNSGASMLAEGLVGFQTGNLDGAGTGIPGMNPPDSSELGFRLNKNAAIMGGKILGPYVVPDGKNFRGTVFIDAWENPIIYYRSRRSLPGVTGTVPSGTPVFDAANPNSYFNGTDCTATVIAATNSAATPPGTANVFFTLINGSNSPIGSGSVIGSSSYLLISAGPDEKYFTADDIVGSK